MRPSIRKSPERLEATWCDPRPLHWGKGCGVRLEVVDVCGIAGIVDVRGLAEEDGRAIGRMTAALHHRGPDDSGAFLDGHSALGHARLSIIDLATGHQPMCNEDESVWIVFNGEIYNFP